MTTEIRVSRSSKLLALLNVTIKSGRVIASTRPFKKSGTNNTNEEMNEDEERVNETVKELSDDGSPSLSKKSNEECLEWQPKDKAGY